MDIERGKRFADLAKEIQDVDAYEAGSLAYVARVLAQVTLPHAKTDALKFERSSGAVTIAMRGNPENGLPYGTYPRLIMSWVATEAVRTQSPVLELGDSLSAFMAELGIVPHGGRWGTITRLREQMQRLFDTAISWTTHRESGSELVQVLPFERTTLWWDPQRPAQKELWRSQLGLNQLFFKALIERPVPVDMRALKALAREGRSPLALDIYTWLTYRMSYLEEPVTVPWSGLLLQFGAGYRHTRQFKAKFLVRLEEVKELYPAARVKAVDKGLLLEPSPTHVPRLVKPKIKLLSNAP